MAARGRWVRPSLRCSSSLKTGTSLGLVRAPTAPVDAPRLACALATLAAVSWPSGADRRWDCLRQRCSGGPMRAAQRTPLTGIIQWKAGTRKCRPARAEFALQQFLAEEALPVREPQGLPNHGISPPPLEKGSLWARGRDDRSTRR